MRNSRSVYKTKGCFLFTGHSLASFFAKSTQRANYMFHDDAASRQEIAAHLASLARQIEDREPSPPQPAPKLLLTAGGEAETPARSKTDAEWKEVLRKQAEEFEGRLRAKDEERDDLMREKNDEIAALRARLREKGDLM
jgi:hypothetical protein